MILHHVATRSLQRGRREGPDLPVNIAPAAGPTSPRQPHWGIHTLYNIECDAHLALSQPGGRKQAQGWRTAALRCAAGARKRVRIDRVAPPRPPRPASACTLHIKPHIRGGIGRARLVYANRPKSVDSACLQALAAGAMAHITQDKENRMSLGHGAKDGGGKLRSGRLPLADITQLVAVHDKRTEVGFAAPRGAASSGASPNSSWIYTPPLYPPLQALHRSYSAPGMHGQASGSLRTLGAARRVRRVGGCRGSSSVCRPHSTRIHRLRILRPAGGPQQQQREQARSAGQLRRPPWSSG